MCERTPSRPMRGSAPAWSPWVLRHDIWPIYVWDDLSREERFEIENANETPVADNRGRGRHADRSRLSRTRGDDRHAAAVARDGVVGTGACGSAEDRPHPDPGSVAAACAGWTGRDHAPARHHGVRDQFAAAVAAARGAARAGASDGEPGRRARYPRRTPRIRRGGRSHAG